MKIAGREATIRKSYRCTAGGRDMRAVFYLTDATNQNFQLSNSGKWHKNYCPPSDPYAYFDTQAAAEAFAAQHADLGEVVPAAIEADELTVTLTETAALREQLAAANARAERALTSMRHWRDEMIESDDWYKLTAAQCLLRFGDAIESAAQAAAGEARE